MNDEPCNCPVCNTRRDGRWRDKDEELRHVEYTIFKFCMEKLNVTDHIFVGLQGTDDQGRPGFVRSARGDMHDLADLLIEMAAADEEFLFLLMQKVMIHSMGRMNQIAEGVFKFPGGTALSMNKKQFVDLMEKLSNLNPKEGE